MATNDALNDFMEVIMRGMNDLYETLRLQFQEGMRELREESTDNSRRIEEILHRIDSEEAGERENGRHDTAPDTVAQNPPRTRGVTEPTWPEGPRGITIDSGVGSGFTSGGPPGTACENPFGWILGGPDQNVPRSEEAFWSAPVARSGVSQEQRMEPPGSGQWNAQRPVPAPRGHTGRHPAGVTFELGGRTYGTASDDPMWRGESQPSARGGERMRTEPTHSYRTSGDQPLLTATRSTGRDSAPPTFEEYMGHPVSPLATGYHSPRPIAVTTSVWSHPHTRTILSTIAEEGRSSYEGTTSRLQPTTPVRPTGGWATPRCVEGGQGVYRLKVDHYDGKTPLEDYLIQFNVVASALRWDRDQMTTMLAASLRGQALAVLSSLQPEYRQDWDRLLGALKLRFGREHLRELAHVELKARRQKPREDLAAFADEIRKLVRRAFPECPPAPQDRIAIQQFLDGISDLDVQDWVRMARPATLDMAVVFAIECETSRRATRSNRTNARAATVETPREDADSINRSPTSPGGRGRGGRGFRGRFQERRDQRPPRTDANTRPSDPPPSTESETIPVRSARVVNVSERPNTLKTKYRRNLCREYSARDKVWLFNPRRRKGSSPEVQSDWEGPYVVLKRINNAFYRIQSRRKKRKVVHVDRLAPYRDKVVDRDDQH